MENIELLRGVVSDETFARIEEETKESKIRLADLSTGQDLVQNSVDGYRILVSMFLTDKLGFVMVIRV